MKEKITTEKEVKRGGDRMTTREQILAVVKKVEVRPFDQLRPADFEIWEEYKALLQTNRALFDAIYLQALDELKAHHYINGL